MLAVNKFKKSLFALFAAFVIIYAFTWLDGYKPSIGSLIYLFSGVPVLFANKRILALMPPEDYKETVRATKKLALKLTGGSILAIGGVAAILYLLTSLEDTIKTNTPSQSASLRTSASPSRGTGAVIKSNEERIAEDMQRIYRGLPTNPNPNYDVGGHCNRAIRGTDITLEQCLGMFLRKNN